MQYMNCGIYGFNRIEPTKTGKYHLVAFPAHLGGLVCIAHKVGKHWQLTIQDTGQALVSGKKTRDAIIEYAHHRLSLLAAKDGGIDGLLHAVEFQRKEYADKSPKG